MTTLTTPHSTDSPLRFALLAVVLGGLAGASLLVLPEPLFLAAALFGLGAIVVLVRRPAWGLYALVFITYIRLSDVLVNNHELPSLFKVFVPLLGAIILWRWLIKRETPTGWRGPLLWMGGYVVIGCSTLLYGRDQLLSTEGAETLVKDVAVALIIVMLLQRAVHLHRVVWSVIAAGIFLGSLSVYQQITGAYTNNFLGFAQATVEHIVGELDHFRTAGPLTPNFYALILVAIVPLALDRFWHESRLLLRLLAGWAVAVTVLSILFTFSRGGFLALLIVLGLLFLRYRPRPLTLIVTGCLLVLLLVLAPANYQERMWTMVEELPRLGESNMVTEGSFRGRLSEVTVAAQIFADHPFIGVGYDNFDVYYLDYSQYVGLDTRREERQAHNLFMEVAAETGLLGLLTFLLLLTGLVYSVRRARQLFNQMGARRAIYLVDALAISMMGYLAGSLFLHAAFPRYFWLLAAIVLALPQVAANEATAAQPSDTGEIT
jgi:O-antigen ligase